MRDASWENALKKCEMKMQGAEEIQIQSDLSATKSKEYDGDFRWGYKSHIFLMCSNVGIIYALPELKIKEKCAILISNLTVNRRHIPCWLAFSINRLRGVATCMHVRKCLQLCLPEKYAGHSLFTFKGDGKTKTPPAPHNKNTNSILHAPAIS